jgi:hypothetical protein
MTLTKVMLSLICVMLICVRLVLRLLILFSFPFCNKYSALFKKKKKKIVLHFCKKLLDWII